MVAAAIGKSVVTLNFPKTTRQYYKRASTHAYAITTYSTNVSAHAHRADLRAGSSAPADADCKNAAQYHHRAGGPSRRGHLPDALRTVLRGHQLRRRRRALSRTGEESLVRVSRPDDGLEERGSWRGERDAANLRRRFAKPSAQCALPANQSGLRRRFRRLQ